MSLNRTAGPTLSVGSRAAIVSPVLANLSIRTLRGIGTEEKSHRIKVLDGVMNRITGGREQSSRSLRKVIAATHRVIRKQHKASARVVRRAVNQGGAVAADVASNVLQQLSPLQAALAIREIKNAAILFRTQPDKQKEARVKMLLGLSEIGASLYQVSSISNPIGLAVAFTLTSGVKIANYFSNLTIKGRYKEDKDRLNKIVSRLAENPIVRPLANLMLRLVSKLDLGLSKGVQGLKDNFAKSATEKEKRRGIKLLEQFHKLYSEYYPDAQAEKRETMSKFLADKNDSWNLHTIEKSGKVIGGFTCFHLEDPRFGKQLYIEQLLPPFHKDALLNATTWEYIRKLAKDSGTNRIWLEIPGSERLPADFKELDILYAQPTLTNKETGPVGLKGRGKEDPVNVLRMSVLTLDESAPGPSYREFWKMIVKGCVADWAPKNDPAWKMLCRNPRNENVIPVREQAI